MGIGRSGNGPKWESAEVGFRLSGITPSGNGPKWDRLGLSGNHLCRYTLMLCCWDRGQSTPVHDHGGSRKWIKILEGEMQVHWSTPVSTQ